MMHAAGVGEVKLRRFAIHTSASQSVDMSVPLLGTSARSSRPGRCSRLTPSRLALCALLGLLAGNWKLRGMQQQVQDLRDEILRTEAVLAEVLQDYQ